MTSIQLPARDERVVDTSVADRRRPRLTEVLTIGSVAAFLLVWALPVTHGTGGRAAWALGLGVVSLLPALLLVRPWSRVPLWLTALAMAPAAAGLVVCLTAPTGFDGLDETAGLAYAGGAFLVVRGWVDGHSTRRQLVLVVLALAGLEQFTQAYLPWWGGGSVRTLMTGTFYWHNQYAAFILGTGLVAGVLAVRGSGPARLAGWLVAPWCFASLLFAGSRAGLATFAVCWLLVIGLSVRDRRGRVASLVLLGVALALATLLTSPLLMADSGWFSSTVQAREADESVEGNGQARLVFWRATVELGSHRPLTGAGFDSFGGAGSARMPAEAGLSTYAHNGYLQAFSDGGLLLALAICGAVGATLLVGARWLLAGARRRAGDGSAVAVPVALLALALHAGVDFDWAYPSLVVLFAILAALLPSAPATARARPGSSLLGAVLVLALVSGALPAALRASGLHAADAPVPRWAAPVAALVPVHGALDWLPAAGVCRNELASGRTPAVREHGSRCAAEAAEDDPGLQLLRARAMVLDGHTAAGLASAAEVVSRYGERRPMLRVLYADTLGAAGQVDSAVSVLQDLRAELLSRGLTSQARAVEQVLSRHGSSVTS
jgi:O-antigen ligase